MEIVKTKVRKHFFINKTRKWVSRY